MEMQTQGSCILARDMDDVGWDVPGHLVVFLVTLQYRVYGR